MRNDIYRARARWVVRVRSHELDVDSDPIMGGSTHPVGVPMADAILLEEILRTWTYNQIYMYVRVRADESPWRVVGKTPYVCSRLCYFPSLIYVARRGGSGIAPA